MRTATARKLALLWIGLSTFLWAGCTTTGRPTSTAALHSTSPANELHLFGVPLALDLDDVPGPDGFVVRVFYSRSTRARGIPITSGTVEILMFDGVLMDGTLGGAAAALPVPLRVWPFTAEQLKPFSTRTSLGVGYQFVLRWGDNKPTGDHLTVVARYLPSTGPALLSTPSSISTGIN